MPSGEYRARVTLSNLGFSEYSRPGVDEVIVYVSKSVNMSVTLRHDGSSVNA